MKRGDKGVASSGAAAETGVVDRYAEPALIRVAPPAPAKKSDAHTYGYGAAAAAAAPAPDAAVRATYGTVRDFIAAPLYEMACPGLVPPVEVVQDPYRESEDREWRIPEGASSSEDRVRAEDWKMHTRCDMGGIRQLGDLGKESSVLGFERAVAASMLMGDTMSDEIKFKEVVLQWKGAGASASAAEVRELRAVKADHSGALLVRAECTEDLVDNLEALFFAKGSRYNTYLSAGTITFDPRDFKREIDRACKKLTEKEVRTTIAAQVDALEAGGISFKELLTRHKGTFFSIQEPLARSLHGDKDPPAIKTKEALVDFYVQNVMRQRDLMQELSQDLEWMLEQTGAQDVKPVEMMGWMRYMEQARSEEMEARGAVASAGAASSAGAAAASASAAAAAAAPGQASGTGKRWMPESIPDLPLELRALTKAEKGNIERIARNVGEDLFQGGAGDKGRRVKDVERIESHLKKICLKLKREGHKVELAIGYGAEHKGDFFSALIGTHTSELKGKWTAKANPNCLSQIYYDGSEYTQAGKLTGGIYMPESCFAPGSGLDEKVEKGILSFIKSRESSRTR